MKLAIQIRYVTGDATAPEGPGPKIIAHICNDIGGWGRGFVNAISRRWPEPEQSYRAWHAQNGAQPFALGEIQLVPVADDIWIANMIAQHGIRRKGGSPPIRYEALRSALKKLAAAAKEIGATTHMPRIGCGLAGGEWSKEIGRAHV